MKPFRWNHDKNEALKIERSVSFEEIVLALEADGLLDQLRHPNPDKYPNQSVLVVALDAYVYLVPYVEESDYFFLKTVIPSRKATRDYLLGTAQMKKLDAYEKGLLTAYEKGELQSTSPSKADRSKFKAAATATFIKDRRINIRLSSPDLMDIQARALEEGIPYQTLIASVLHKYVSGRLTEKLSNLAPRSIARADKPRSA
jgi:predicted DNA binding CopG/RHH family protein